MVIIISGEISLFPYLDMVKDLLIGMTNSQTRSHTISVSLIHNVDLKAWMEQQQQTFVWIHSLFLQMIDGKYNYT